MNLLKTLAIFLTFTSVTSCETILIFGGENGWIGKKIVKILLNEGYAVYCAKSRLENRESISMEIGTIRPDYIINTAGKIGKPNVDWCEEHQQETIRSNVLGLLNIVDVAFLANIRSRR